MNLKTSGHYLSIISRHPINFGRLILLIFALIFIIIFLSYNSQDEIIDPDYENTSNDLVNNRRRSINGSSSSYNRTGILGIKQHVDKLNSTDYENISSNFIKHRLSTHARFFAESSSSCHNAAGTASVEQQQHFDKIAQALDEFRQQSIPLYSDDNFHGRGIVLTVGPLQIYQCKVNLKMIERTQTRLPVQVK